jgi:hypothetical protein
LVRVERKQNFDKNPRLETVVGFLLACAASQNSRNYEHDNERSTGNSSSTGSR